MTSTVTERESTCRHEARHLAMAVATGKYPTGAQVGGLADWRGIASYRHPALTTHADERWTQALVALAPHIEEAAWPLGSTPDEAEVTATVEHVATKEDREPQEVFAELLDDAECAARRPIYKSLTLAFSRVLELNGRLDQRGIAKVCQLVVKSFNEKGQDMEHKTFTAEPVITDRGVFEALVSTPAEDREKDMVATGAFATTIAHWKSSGKVIPLAWNHGTAPEDLVGHVDPAQMHEGPKGLTVGGKVDLDTERGQQVWRLLKSGSLGFSFGYLITDSVDRPGGGRRITGLDLFEISATSVPMNSGTRVISTKSVDDSAIAKREATVIAEAFAKALPVPRQKSHTDQPIQIATFEC
jgi:HK97 family phage prohead protease